VERENIVKILDMQDSIVDECRDVTHILLVRKTPVPEFLGQGLCDHADICQKAGQTVCEAAAHMRDAMSGEYTQKRRLAMVERLKEVKTMEREAGEVTFSLSKALFDNEKDLNPTDVMICFHLIEEIRHIINDIDNTAEWYIRRLTQ
jgi:uncharacterized protein Yka (UPF0111/DUF47 family)